MEIEVGEYVRNKQGRIFEIIAKDYNEYLTNTIYDGNKHKGYQGRYDHGVKNYLLYLTKEQLSECKHSKNIIDLIEEGDYVNGEYVAVIEKDKEGNITDICYEEENEGQLYSIGDIKSIITKEQFSQMEYKLEE